MLVGTAVAREQVSNEPKSENMSLAEVLQLAWIEVGVQSYMWVTCNKQQEDAAEGMPDIEEMVKGKVAGVIVSPPSLATML